jgi:hypothetical protein
MTYTNSQQLDFQSMIEFKVCSSIVNFRKKSSKVRPQTTATSENEGKIPRYRLKTLKHL